MYKTYINKTKFKKKKKKRFYKKVPVYHKFFFLTRSLLKITGNDLLFTLQSTN